MNKITTDFLGGLGNKLFKVANIIALSLKYNYKPVIPTKTNDKRQNNYFQSFFNQIEKCDIIPTHIHRENGFQFKEINIPTHEKKNTLVFGYYQSHKYFNTYKSEIISILRLPENMEKGIEEKYRDILSLPYIVSLHVRRGDYLNVSHLFEILDVDYYKKAITYFPNNTHFLIFSDDIEWCRNNLNFIKNKTFIHDLETHEIYIMSKCNGNIIANSSYSWWGAYFNENPDKIIAPLKWFTPKYSNSHDTRDLIPDNWLRM